MRPRPHVGRLPHRWPLFADAPKANWAAWPRLFCRLAVLSARDSALMLGIAMGLARLFGLEGGGFSGRLGLVPPVRWWVMAPVRVAGGGMVKGAADRAGCAWLQISGQYRGLARPPRRVQGPGQRPWPVWRLVRACFLGRLSPEPDCWRLAVVQYASWAMFAASSAWAGGLFGQGPGGHPPETPDCGSAPVWRPGASCCLCKASSPAALAWAVLSASETARCNSPSFCWAWARAMAS